MTDLPPAATVHAPTWSSFRQYVETYSPFPFEMTQKPGVAGRVSHFEANARHFHALLSAVWPYCRSRATLCDFGAYPGNLVRLLRELRPELSMRLIAAGLIESDAFSDAMGALDVEWQQSISIRFTMVFRLEPTILRIG